MDGRVLRESLHVDGWSLCQVNLMDIKWVEWNDAMNRIMLTEKKKNVTETTAQTKQNQNKRKITTRRNAIAWYKTQISYIYKIECGNEQETREKGIYSKSVLTIAFDDRWIYMYERKNIHV